MLKKFFPRPPAQMPAVPHKGTEFEVNNWNISEFLVSKLVPVVSYHPFPLNELMLMTAAVCHFKPGLVLEWGTNIGKSARIFYEVSKYYDLPMRIHSIDLPDEVFHNEHPFKDRGKMVRGLAGVTLHQGDGIATSLEILSSSKEEKVLFFVDGDHSYESVKRELQIILEKAPHAAVLLHDTFYQTEESGYNIGPYKAICEVLRPYGDRYRTVSTNMGLPGMTLVYSS